jgi:hypothetical protein
MRTPQNKGEELGLSPKSSQIESEENQATDEKE